MRTHKLREDDALDAAACSVLQSRQQRLNLGAAWQRTCKS